MPQVNPKCFHQSASSIAAFKACPTRWRLLYREGIRPAEDTDSQRVGTNWHAMHEIYAGALAQGVSKDNSLALVVEHLNERYATAPLTKTAEEWSLERNVLLYSFIGYQWYYQDDPIEVLASELPFELPIHNPKLGLPLPVADVLRVGKIDHVIRRQGMVGVLERKSTSRSIAPDSDYWDKSKKDTQVSMYATAFRDMLQQGGGDWMRMTCNEAENEKQSFGNTLYDVWHKPTIKPCMLTQKETTEFCSSQVYCGQTFSVLGNGKTDPELVITVDGEEAKIEVGKKAIAIKETVAMFSARLLQDIYERPDFYFARREIVRTDAEVQKFRKELYNLYQSQKNMAATGHYWENESQCRATFPCSMIPICYGPGADAVCDGVTVPNGFKRIFVDLTVEGQAVEAD